RYLHSFPTRRSSDLECQPVCLLRSRADLDDRAVEPDRGRTLTQPALLFELVDLRVALDQDGLRARLPGQDRLLPHRRVVLLAGRSEEHTSELQSREN